MRDPLPSAAAARTYGMGSWPVVVEITVPPPYGCLVAPAVRSNRYSCLRRREASRAGSKQRPHGDSLLLGLVTIRCVAGHGRLRAATPCNAPPKPHVAVAYS